jgi:hypothetical protein
VRHPLERAMIPALYVGFVVSISSAGLGHVVVQAQTVGNAQVPPVAAGQALPASALPEEPEKPSVPRPSTKDPFKKLFRVPPAVPPTPGVGSPGAVKLSTGPAQVVCGLTMWQMDPTIDSKIRAPLGADTTAFKVRRIVPSICRE